MLRACVNFSITIFFINSCGNISQQIQPQISPSGVLSQQIPPLAVDHRSLVMMEAEPSEISYGSLWNGARANNYYNGRASKRGDAITIIIEIDDEASFDNQTVRTRTESDSVSISSLFGLESIFEIIFPSTVSADLALDTASSQSTVGDGVIQRSEELQLRLAATVIEVLDNGNLFIMGSQEIRVNGELRTIEASGIIRTRDITLENEVLFDRVSEGRVSYGGQGVVSGLQQPRRGRQILDQLLPF